MMTSKPASFPCRLLAVVVLFLAVARPGFAAPPRPCNFDGKNGTDELAVYDWSTGNWFIKTLGGNQVLTPGTNWGWNETFPVPGDYDGDGKGDLAIYQPTTGNWFIKTLGDNRLVAFGDNWGWRQIVSDVSTFTVATSMTVPVPADFSGNGRTDQAIYQRESGYWFVKTLGNNRLLAFAVNWGGDRLVPISADFDGDGRADLAAYDRATGNWYIRTLAGKLLAFAANWGWNGAWPVVADYNGDGRADLAVYDRLRGNWYVKSLGDNKLLYFGGNWGWKETTPVPGDYNGDGVADLAVYHRKTGNWYIKTLGGDRLLAYAFNWGGENTTPVQTYASPASEGMNILCFGDSITWGSGSSSDGPETGYPQLLEKHLNVSMGGFWRVYNEGIPGEYTWGGATRLPRRLDAIRPDIVLLMEGNNDMLYTGMYDATEDSLRAMVGQAIARGVSPVMSTISPVGPTVLWDSASQEQRIEGFNPWIYNIASSYGIPVAPVFENITGVGGWQYSLMDWVPNHPNDAGYLRLEAAFFNTVKDGVQSGRFYH